MRAREVLSVVCDVRSRRTKAFTLLVVGEDNQRDWRNWLRALMLRRGAILPGPARAAHTDKPTRLTLARYAFPGLVKAAERFNRRIFWIVLLLLLGLVMTCVMSWHITGGNAMLQHLDALQSQQTALLKSIDEAEVKHAASANAPPVQFCSGADQAGTPHFRSTDVRLIDAVLDAFMTPIGPVAVGGEGG